ncbi:hypothetical protein HRH25_00990 [Flavisolibacter sp. BT320]|nr:hypothetical protein [Flavisolibacter longurius]
MTPIEFSNQPTSTTRQWSLQGKGYTIVGLLWLCFQVIWFLSFGVHFELEAEKYIHEAKYLLEHQQFTSPRYLFYLTTVLVIMISFLLKLGLAGALLFIMGINLVSYLYFYKALCFFFRDRLSPLFVIVMLLSFWPYQSWSLYLYTECFFYSAVMFLFAHLLLFRNLTTGYILALFAILSFVVFSRPLGILFVPPVLLFIFFKLSKKQRFFFFGTVILALLALNFIVQVVFTTTRDWNMQRAITEGDIICDIPGEKVDDLVLTNHPNQLYQLSYYLIHNFDHFFGLAVVRLRYFFTMIRSYYSPFHNGFLIGYLALWYGCFLIGIRKLLYVFPVAVTVFILSSIFLFAMTVALQCDDYHNRFFLTLSPFFSVSSIVVLKPLIYRLLFFAKQHKG